MKVIAILVDKSQHVLEFGECDTIKDVRAWLNISSSFIDIGGEDIINAQQIVHIKPMSAEQKRVDDMLDSAIGEAKEGPRPYFCVQHGGCSLGEKVNRKNGFTCPKCDQDGIVEEIKGRNE